MFNVSILGNFGDNAEKFYTEGCFSMKNFFIYYVNT